MIMNFLTILQDIFFILSSVMLYPVMILLIIFFIWVVVTIGEFVSEYLERRKYACKRDSEEFIGSFEKMDFLKGMPFYFQEYFSELAVELKENKSSKDIRIEYLLQSREQKMVKSLDKLRLMVRVGPTLGLMGTIIPMGPALSALSQGDLEMLSNNIIIAFTTTVVGLAVGVIAYFLSMVKNRWVNEDIKDLEYFTERITASQKPLNA